MDSKRKTPLTQHHLLMDFFKKNPHRDIPHPEIVDWATAEWMKRTGNVFRDPDRGIRKLHQSGYLIKVKKGVYRYHPEDVKRRRPEDFSAEQKRKILERDQYRCVICGRGKKDGVELHVDHIKPKDLGGKATIENGQTLCAQHNFIKKNLKQTETGKKMFIRLYHLAKKENNDELLTFCTDILKIYEAHAMNGHIVWEK
ncbi:MAG: HNH endonuclease [Alphaproteobacteria bacterium GM7ARS4]|nr:HNH endonuclease [Alphaproteobacteria bacterium GM7ARS4]